MLPAFEAKGEWGCTGKLRKRWQNMANQLSSPKWKPYIENYRNPGPLAHRGIAARLFGMIRHGVFASCRSVRMFLGRHAVGWWSDVIFFRWRRWWKKNNCCSDKMTEWRNVGFIQQMAMNEWMNEWMNSWIFMIYQVQAWPFSKTEHGAPKPAIADTW